ncbi:MAG: hypothetical protein NT023_09410, partial [Armatimonadetes bacterium]|nr:hypothetical protein [Armatimonadota bacterium]
TGVVLSSSRYTAFGTPFDALPAGEPFGFGGQFGYYTDAETGFQLSGLRYYSPGAGRFLNRDPILYSGGANLYNYVANNPVSKFDPVGLTPFPGYNWCGPGDRGTGPNSWLDAACQKHDQCYKDRGGSADNKLDTNLDSCDAQLMLDAINDACLGNLTHPLDRNWYDPLTDIGINIYFGLYIMYRHTADWISSGSQWLYNGVNGWIRAY